MKRLKVINWWLDASATVWHEGAEDELDMLYGEKMYTRKFIGITAARKILSTEEIAQYTHKAAGAPKMVKESAKGEPIVLSGLIISTHLISARPLNIAATFLKEPK